MRLCATASIADLFASVAAADISEQDRASIDRVIGHKGTYIPEEGVYKVMLPREETTIVQDYQRLSESRLKLLGGLHIRCPSRGSEHLFLHALRSLILVRTDLGVGGRISRPIQNPSRACA